MKITSTMPPAVGREHAKPAKTSQAVTEAPQANAPTEAPATPSSGSTVPAGLERVLEHLQNLPAERLNKGQANALQHIERNIARYRENHGIVDATPAPVITSPPTETAPPTGTTPPTETTPPTGTTSPTETPPPVDTLPPAGTLPPTETAPPTGAAPPTDTTPPIGTPPPAGSLVDTKV